MELPGKLTASLRLLDLLPNLISANSRRGIIDVLKLTTQLIPIRHVTHSSGTTVNEGSVYGLTSAEDTSLAGQKISPSHKASLQLFLKPILSKLATIIDENATNTSQNTLFVNVALSSLFRMAHSVASFRQSIDTSSLPISSSPLPPVLLPPSRPQINPDIELEVLLEDAMAQICNLIEKCGMSPLNLLFSWNHVFQKRIKSTGNQDQDQFTTSIDVPDITDDIADFNQFGISACLFEAMQLYAPSKPDPWFIIHPTSITEHLLLHTRAAMTSRCFFAPTLVHRLLSYHPSTTKYDISYPMSYILQNEILPHQIAHKAYLAIRACIEFGIRMPDTRLRQASFASISGLIGLFDSDAQYKLIYLLSKTCPYPSAQSLLIHLMKECWLAAHSAYLSATSASSLTASAKQPTMSSTQDSVPPSSTSPTTMPILLSKYLFTEFFAKEALKISGLEQRYDTVSAALNFLRAILLRDAKSKVCELWAPDVLESFKKTVLAPLNTAFLQVIAQHQKDDSFHDRQRIQGELATKGMGSMSLDQLASSQAQTILNWQLAHSILQRIEELLAEAKQIVS